MATLIPVAYMEKTNTPFVWFCSDCRDVFSLDRMAENPSVTELKKVDANFRTHCKNRHPEAAVGGLNIPEPKEDTSQAAARVVREATENK
jgi:hypothetical protein